MKPLVIDLYSGLAGELVLQDVLTLHGSQFKDATVIVASPPCQAYSYRAMPWRRAKELPPPDNTLFEACFRIQREACEAAGRYIPMVVENVCGAQKWVGRAKWHYGSFYLWGDVPALMPFAGHSKNGHLNGGSWFAVAHNTTSGHSKNPDGRKVPGLDWKPPGHPKHQTGAAFNTTAEARMKDGVKVPTNGAGWWHDSTNNLIRKASSRSQARKAASALIARIPLPLAQHIARTFKPS